MSEAAPVRPTMSLRLRVAAAVASVLVVGGVTVVIAALAFGRQAAGQVYDGLLIGAASDIAESIAVREGSAVVSLPVSAFELLGQAPEDRVRYAVIGPGGALVTGDPAAPRPPTDAEPAFYDGTFGSEPARYVAVTRRFAERSFSGPVQVIVGQTTRARQALARDIARKALISLSAAGVAMALLAWLAVSRALTPMSRLSRSLANRSPTDLTPISGAAPQEIAAVQGSFNDFMDRLRRQAEASGKLIADTAHQLRTPVAAIRAQLQLAADDEADPQDRAAALARAETRTAALHRLLDQMLAHAMVNHRADAVLHETVDLRDVAVEMLEACDDLIARDAARVQLRLPDQPVEILGDALSLAEAGKNLLTNALRHGRQPITVGVQSCAPVLFVRDAGAGPAEDPETLAERHASPRAGGGLGLAIARDVALSHGGRLSFRREPDGFVSALEFGKC